MTDTKHIRAYCDEIILSVNVDTAKTDHDGTIERLADFADKAHTDLPLLCDELDKANARLKELESGEYAREIATEFYYWWHNQGGTNTQQGFQDWWKLNKKRFHHE